MQKKKNLYKAGGNETGKVTEEGCFRNFFYVQLCRTLGVGWGEEGA